VTFGPTRFLAIPLLLAGFGMAPESAATGRLVGGEFVYAVRPGDSLALVGARFGVDAALLARSNGIPRAARLSVGRRLRVDNRRIVPRRRR
jgi:L,D-transpeptidase ErfK/SrfK